MAQNITLMGADYPDVPAVDLPKTGGGTARFVDALGVVTSVNGETGDVTVDSESIGALPTSAKSALYYGQVDSTSTSTAYTAQIPGITEYFDGLTVILKNGVVTSASGFTININGLGVNKINASYYYTDGTHHNDKGRMRFGNYIGRNLISPQPAHYIGAQEEGPSYTNMLDEAGWTDGVRLSSSGADSADAGFVTSGYIPCQYLDYIYLKNVTYNSASSSASSQRICFYDSSKTFISGCISGANATAQLGKEYDSSNDLVKFQIANVGSNSAANAAYFRICAPHIGSDSIITVNEPIE